jgi:hypothetical protein
MAGGNIIGGILGAGLGTLANPGAGTSAGWALGSSVGGVAEGLAGWGKANNMQLPQVDPRQRLLYDEIARKRRALETGVFYQPQQDVIRQAGAQGMQTAAGITGGDVGATVSALGQINRGTGRNLNELYNQMQQQSLGLLQQQIPLGQKIAEQIWAQKAYEKQAALTNAATVLKESMEGLNAGIASGGFNNLLGLNGATNNAPTSYNQQQVGQTPVMQQYNPSASPWNQAIDQWFPLAISQYSAPITNMAPQQYNPSASPWNQAIDQWSTLATNQYSAPITNMASQPNRIASLINTIFGNRNNRYRDDAQPSIWQRMRDRRFNAEFE